MSGPVEVLLLIAAVLAVLILVTAAALAIRARVGDGPAVETFLARVRSWWGMATLLALAMIFGRGGVVILFALISFAAMREFLTLTAKSRADHSALAAAFFVVLPLQYWFVWDDWYGMYSIFVPVWAFLLLPVISAVRGDTDGFLSRVSETQWGLMICVFAASHVPALLTLRIPGFEGKSILLIGFLVVVVQSADVLRYAIDRLAGTRPLAPALSRSKTWEGFAGGVGAASLLGAMLWWITPFSPAQAFLLSLMISLMGYAGGLVMAAIKRDKGVRDWSHQIPGHGGFIDRLDSVVFAAPIFFHVVRYYWSTV